MSHAGTLSGFAAAAGLTPLASHISLLAMTSSETRYLRQDSGRLAYDVTGDGPLVVCLPGMGDLRSVYRFLTPRLVEAGYRVATMDLRGHGDSDDAFDRYDDETAGADALALIDHLGGGPAVLVGNSMGAAAAVWAAAEAPERVGGLALLGPFVRDKPMAAWLRSLVRLGSRLLLLRPWGPAAWNAYYRRSYPGRPPADLTEYRSRLRRSLGMGRHWRSFTRTARLSHAPAEARLSEVRAPALVVMGDRDGDFQDPVAEARYVAGRLDADTVIVPGAGHYPQAEYPEIVAPAVVGFLRRVAANA
jgi:pimeloyl-ACP methyl ester carboxylesterase